MPFVRHLIYKEENNCEMAQQHSNCSVFFDQYFHPPSVDRERRERMMKNKFILIIVPVYRFRGGGKQPSCTVSTLLFPFNASRAWPGAEGSTSYLTFCRQDLLYWPLFYAIIPELFIGPVPHWWTDAFPANDRSVMLTEPQHWYCCLLPCFSLYVRMFFARRLTHPSEIWTSHLCLFSEPTSPYKPYLLIDTELLTWFLATCFLL